MKSASVNLMLCAGLVILMTSCGKADRSQARGRTNAAPRAVRVARAEVRGMERAVAVTGTLAAQEQSTLGAKVSGRLQRLLVDVGSVVREGDLVAQIEARDYELELQQAAAALAQARAGLGLPLDGKDDRVELEGITAVKQAKAVFDEAAKNRDRVAKLSQAGIASQSELDTVEATYTVALTKFDTAREDSRTRIAVLAGRRAAYETAQQQLTDTAVRAPYDGAVQSRPASVGEYLAVGTPIVRLVKTDPLRLRLEVPERQAMLVRTGQLVRLTVEGNTNIFTGRIARLSPALSELDRMLLVEADVPSCGVLRPGLFARAEVIVNDREEGVSVPANSLVTFAGIEKIVTIKDGKALEKTVTTGRRGSDWMEVVSGLAAGDTIVLDPGGLRTGQPVSVAESNRSSQAAAKGAASSQ